MVPRKHQCGLMTGRKGDVIATGEEAGEEETNFVVLT